MLSVQRAAVLSGIVAAVCSLLSAVCCLPFAVCCLLSAVCRHYHTVLGIQRKDRGREVRIAQR
jgi:hypothetical protein